MKKMKIIFLFIYFSINLFAGQIQTVDIEKKLSKQNCSNIENFSDKQIENIISAYIWGLPYNLEYILPAIAWQESCAGLYKVNLYDPSAGLFHLYIPSVMARHSDLKDDKYNRNKIAQMLINDDKFAASEAISELLFWKNYYKENDEWRNYNKDKFIIMSYNRGSRWQNSLKNKKSAENYYNSIKYKIKYIENFINKNEIEKIIKNTYNIK